MGWTSIYHLFWGSRHGTRVLTHPQFTAQTGIIWECDSLFPVGYILADEIAWFESDIVCCKRHRYQVYNDWASCNKPGMMSKHWSNSKISNLTKIIQDLSAKKRSELWVLESCLNRFAVRKPGVVSRKDLIDAQIVKPLAYICIHWCVLIELESWGVLITWFTLLTSILQA